MKNPILIKSRQYMLIGMFLIGVLSCTQKKEVADYVFTNGKIYTVDPAQPWAEAIAIKGNKIIFVGNTEDARHFSSESTKVADLEGRLVLPGMVDSHLHVMLGAAMTSGVLLAEIPTIEEVLSAIKSYADEHPEKEVIFGWGYGHQIFGPEGPTKDLLDDIIPERPVFLFRSDCHSGWANSMALQRAGVDKNTPDPAPPAGVFGRDQEGNPTGAINGGPANLWMIDRLPEAVTSKSIKEAADPLLRAINEEGITTIFDAGLAIAEDACFQTLVEMDQAGELPLRYFASYYINADYMVEGAIDRLKELDSKYHSNNLDIIALKITTDGVVENRKAAVWEAYLDGTGGGELNFKPEDIIRLSIDAATEGYDVYMHAIGDRAVSTGLDAAEAVRLAGYNKTHLTISHTQLVAEKDFPRFKAADVMINSTGGWWPFFLLEEELEVLGERAHQEYPFRYMIDEGVVFTQGSDFPGDPRIGPFIHMEGSVTRLFYGIPGVPASDVVKNPDNRLSVHEAIESYTINGAKLVHMEDQIGSLEVGKLADLIVVDQNILKIDPGQIHKTKVLLTMLDGKIWHDVILGWGDAIDDPLPDIHIDGFCCERDYHVGRRP